MEKIEKILKRYTNLTLNDIENKYISNCLTYHNYDHITLLLNKFSWEFSDDINDMFILTILFHDIVYVPGNSDNEYLSGMYLKNNSIDSEIVDMAVDLICSTSYNVFSENEYFLYFLKLDFNILLEPYISDLDESIKELERNIRGEHKKVPKIIYTINRKKVLINFRKMITKYLPELGDYLVIDYIIRTI